MASSAISSRVSAVLTGRVATALSIYNFVFLVTRLAQQIYAPVIGPIKDAVSSGKIGDQGLPQLEHWFRQILAGAALGALLGWWAMCW
ncbi:DUF2837 family protein [bacterium]|nr:DUF2837 family protein [bacterium]